jgi:hypothetical protein
VDFLIRVLLKIWRTASATILTKVFLCPKWFKNNLKVYSKKNELDT